MTILYENTAGRKRITKVREFNGQKVECIYMEGLRPVSWEEYNKLSDEEKLYYLPVKPLESCTFDIAPDIMCQQDVAITLRDGVKAYVDIYRPKTDAKVPVIMVWSAYGKQPFYTTPDLKTKGVPVEAISRYTKEEGPDPMYWCRHGYAVANVDPRGIGNSEGDVEFFGTSEGRDGYDVIEALSAMDWCNGKVGMCGNSYLSMCQWKIAAQQPPHLACIAPWEGTADLYREWLFEGGIPGPSFTGAVIARAASRGYVDDMPAMAKKYPNLDCPYWQDKVAEFEKINMPAYVTAGLNHFHLRGTMNGWRHISSKQKWLRIHRDFEWPDFYSTEVTEDLRRFFDRYLRDIPNGWELTPTVRLQVMDAYDLDYQTNRPEADFPIPRTEYKKLYLSADTCTITEAPLRNHCHVSYDGETGLVNFDYKFEEETELTGYFKLKLWVEAQGHDDMDLFVNIQKLSTTGEWIPTQVFDQPHPGAWGKMRVSRRRLDEKESTDFNPVQAYVDTQKLSPGEIVPVVIEIVPTSRIWHEGQSLRVQIAGRYIREGWFEPLKWDTDNHGQHVIHTGGQYDSYLQIPVVPPRFRDGKTIIR